MPSNSLQRDDSWNPWVSQTLATTKGRFSNRTRFNYSKKWQCFAQTCHVPHRVMWMHLYGAWRPSYPTAGEGVDEASYHRTPACSPKLIQSVSDQNRRERKQHLTPRSRVKKTAAAVFSCRLSVGGQSVTRSTTQEAFPKGKALRVFWLFGGGRLCDRLNRRLSWIKIPGNAGLHRLSLNITRLSMTLNWDRCIFREDRQTGRTRGCNKNILTWQGNVWKCPLLVLSYYLFYISTTFVPSRRAYKSFAWRLTVNAFKTFFFSSVCICACL